MVRAQNPPPNSLCDAHNPKLLEKLFDVTTKQARIPDFEWGGARKCGKLVGRQSFRWGANFSLLLFLNEVDLETTIQNAI